MGECDLVPLFGVEGVDDVREEVVFLVVDVGGEQQERLRNVGSGGAVGEPSVEVVVLAAPAPSI